MITFTTCKFSLQVALPILYAASSPQTLMSLGASLPTNSVALSLATSFSNAEAQKLSRGKFPQYSPFFSNGTANSIMMTSISDVNISTLALRR
jgi:hypothetical protein